MYKYVFYHVYTNAFYALYAFRTVCEEMIYMYRWWGEVQHISASLNTQVSMGIWTANFASTKFSSSWLEVSANTDMLDLCNNQKIFCVVVVDVIVVVVIVSLGTAIVRLCLAFLCLYFHSLSIFVIILYKHALCCNNAVCLLVWLSVNLLVIFVSFTEQIVVHFKTIVLVFLIVKLWWNLSLNGDAKYSFSGKTGSFWPMFLSSRVNNVNWTCCYASLIEIRVWCCIRSRLTLSK